jgi:hypothetical protein
MPSQTETQDRLQAAIAARAETQAQVNDLRERLRETSLQVEAAQRRREGVAHAAIVGKNATARKALDKYAEEVRAGQSEVGNLELALKEAERLHEEADVRFYEADADARYAKAQELRGAILELDREIDDAFAAVCAKFGDREALLDQLQSTDVFDGFRRTQVRVDEWTFGRMFAHTINLPNAHQALTRAFPNAFQFRGAASTLYEMDQSRLGLQRPDAKQARTKAQSTAVPGTGNKREAGILDDERYRVPRSSSRERGMEAPDGHEVNPLTGQRIAGSQLGGFNQDEMAEAARRTQPPESGSGMRTVAEHEVE